MKLISLYIILFCCGCSLFNKPKDFINTKPIQNEIVLGKEDYRRINLEDEIKGISVITNEINKDAVSKDSILQKVLPISERLKDKDVKLKSNDKIVEKIVEQNIELNSARTLRYESTMSYLSYIGMLMILAGAISAIVLVVLKIPNIMLSTSLGFVGLVLIAISIVALEYKIVFVVVGIIAIITLVSMWIRFIYNTFFKKNK